MRNKFVYSCSIKNPCFRVSRILGKHFLPPAGCGSIFLAKHCWHALRGCSQLARGQVNMADDAKLGSPICSTLEALVVWRAVQRSHREKLGLSCWPSLAAGVADFSASHQFVECTSQIWWFHQDSESRSGSDQQQTTKQWLWLFFGASLALGSALELLLSPAIELVITGCCVKSTFGCMSESDQEIVRCCRVE